MAWESSRAAGKKGPRRLCIQAGVAALKARFRAKVSWKVWRGRSRGCGPTRRPTLPGGRRPRRRATSPERVPDLPQVVVDQFDYGGAHTGILPDVRVELPGLFPYRLHAGGAVAVLAPALLEVPRVPSVDHVAEDRQVRKEKRRQWPSGPRSGGWCWGVPSTAANLRPPPSPRITESCRAEEVIPTPEAEST